MNNLKTLTILLIIFSVSLICTGCKKSATKVVITNLGFTMMLPTGWQVDPKDNSNFYELNKKEDNFGWVAEYELEEDESLVEFVDSLIVDAQNIERMQSEMLKSLGKETDETEYPETRVISKNQRKVSGLDAIELISEANFFVFEVYIQKDRKVIQVTFRILTDDFPQCEPSLRKAIESISIQ